VVLAGIGQAGLARLIDVCSGFIHGEDDCLRFHALFPSLPDAGPCGLPAPVHGFGLKFLDLLRFWYSVSMVWTRFSSFVLGMV